MNANVFLLLVILTIGGVNSGTSGPCTNYQASKGHACLQAMSIYLSDGYMARVTDSQKCSAAKDFCVCMSRIPTTCLTRMKGEIQAANAQLPINCTKASTPTRRPTTKAPNTPAHQNKNFTQSPCKTSEIGLVANCLVQLNSKINPTQSQDRICRLTLFLGLNVSLIIVPKRPIHHSKRRDENCDAESLGGQCAVSQYNVCTKGVSSACKNKANQIKGTAIIKDINSCNLKSHNSSGRAVQISALTVTFTTLLLARF